MPINASNIMNTPVISIEPDAPLIEAIKILEENNISGLPVVDAENKVIGIITGKDIVEYSYTLHVIPLIGSSGWVSPYTDVSEIATAKEGFEQLASVKIKDVMTKKVIKVKENTSVLEIANLMKKKKINRIPVVDEEGKLSGIIARADLLNCLAERES